MNDQHHSIADKVLERIARTEPRSRRYFVLHNILLWLGALLAVVAGALAVASILYRTLNAGQAFLPGRPPVSDLLLVTPVVWIVLLCAFGSLAYREIRKTRRGYRYELVTLVLLLVVGSGILGGVFYVSGAGFLLDRAAARYLPFHPDLEHMQRERWHHPEQGFLLGTVLEYTDQSLLLLDPDEIQWHVLLEDAVYPQGPGTPPVGSRVGIRGVLDQEREHTFRACDIRSLELRGRHGPRFGQGTRNGYLRERNQQGVRSSQCEDVRPHDY